MKTSGLLPEECKARQRLTRFEFSDEEIKVIGVVLTKYIEYNGRVDWYCEIADEILHKMGKDIGRIYRAEAKKARVDISKVVA